MILNFFRRILLTIFSLLLFSLISYAIFLKDPLNAAFTENIFIGFKDYLSRLAQGDLGISYLDGESLAKTVLTVLPPTLELCFVALLLAFLLGIPLGYLGAMPSYPFFNRIIKSFYLLGFATPIFWLAPIILYFSSLQSWEISAIGQFNLLYDIPHKTGFPLIDVWFIDAPYRIKIIQNLLQHLVLPTLVLTLSPMIEIMRCMQERTEALLEEDYINAALSRSSSHFYVLLNYILRNSLPQLLARFPHLFILVLTQCMLIEGTFAWPGLGRWLIDNVQQQDYNSISAGIMTLGLCILSVHIATHLLQFAFDPLNKKGWYVN